jgi:hypothetical protein
MAFRVGGIDAVRGGISTHGGIYVFDQTAEELILAAMGKSVLSVVPGLSPVYNRLGNPAEYGDNISRIGNLGTDANDPVQTVEAEQPVFRDVGNAADYGDGYLYCDGVVGSYASIPDPLGTLGDFTLQVDGLSPESVRPAATSTLMSQHAGSAATASFILIVNAAGKVYLYLYDGTDEVHNSISVPTDTVGIRVTRVGTLITYWVDTGSGYVSHDTKTSVGTVLNNPTSAFQVGIYKSTASPLLGTISRAQVWDNGAQTGDPVVDADFRNATHKLTDTDTFIANSGQQITINGGATVYNPPVASTLRTTTDLGFLDLDGVAGSYASIADPLGSLGDFTLQFDGLSPETVRPDVNSALLAQYGAAASIALRISSAGTLTLNLYTTVDEIHASIAVPTDTVGIRVTRVGTLITYHLPRSDLGQRHRRRHRSSRCRLPQPLHHAHRHRHVRRSQRPDGHDQRRRNGSKEDHA